MLAKAQELINRAVEEEGCLICTLTPSQIYANVKGYGKAHRFIWVAFKGPIPEDVFVCHSCDVPRCIKLDHLFLGTPLRNMQDKVQKGRHTNGARKIIPESEREQIKNLKNLGYSSEDIAVTYGVDRRTIDRYIKS